MLPICVIATVSIKDYRIWQKSGTFAAGALIGMAYGALMGAVYVFARKYLPFSDDRKKAILLAALMYLAFYLVSIVQILLQ